jgi:hypothetical protein
MMLQATPTPGLYGILQKTPIPVIRHQWDELVYPRLKNEFTIYDLSFHTIAFAIKSGSNSITAFRFFIPILGDQGLLPYDAKESEIHLPYLERMFDAYWQISMEACYWESGNYQVMEKHVPFNAAIQVWTASHPGEVEWCKRSLEKWRN